MWIAVEGPAPDRPVTIPTRGLSSAILLSCLPQGSVRRRQNSVEARRELARTVDSSAPEYLVAHRHFDEHGDRAARPNGDADQWQRNVENAVGLLLES